MLLPRLPSGRTSQYKEHTLNTSLHRTKYSFDFPQLLHLPKITFLFLLTHRKTYLKELLSSSGIILLFHIFVTFREGHYKHGKCARVIFYISKISCILENMQHNRRLSDKEVLPVKHSYSLWTKTQVHEDGLAPQTDWHQWARPVVREIAIHFVLVFHSR